MTKFIQNVFTLAEVLITLAILGVVAAVTLPNMVQDQKYQKLGVELSKFASTLENAATAYAISIGGEFDTSNINDLTNFAKNTFILKSGSIDSIPASGYSREYRLKDDTIIKFLNNQIAKPYNANTDVVGTTAFVVEFLPDSKLFNSLPPAGRSFRFVVTKKGYVFPVNSTNDCLISIYDAQYIVKPSMYKTYCK